MTLRGAAASPLTISASPTSVLVRTSRPYSVHVGAGVLANVARELGFHSSIAVLSDETVGPLYRDRLQGLDGAPTLYLPPGEDTKSLSVLERVLDFLVDARLDRRSCLVTLGGGVVGDLGGLAASLYMRGIPVVHGPTTLLAQVDASVGGKTAINLRAGKNLAGSFHQPTAVYADTGVLGTLDDDEFRSGLGEVVKTALLAQDDLLAFVEHHAPEILARDAATLGELVARCVRVKASLVARDERERGLRKQLNLGHTFGHAIEHAAGYGRVPHGVAVGVGLVLALAASRSLGKLEDYELPGRVERLLGALGLERSLEELEDGRGLELTPAALAAGLRHDKKGAAAQPRLVLVRRAGDLECDVAPTAGFWDRFSRFGPR